MLCGSGGPPTGLKWRSNKCFILSTVAVSLFTDLFLNGIITPILPSILEDHVSIPRNEAQRYALTLLAVYTGATVIFSIPVGIIADKLPARQIPFLCGLVALFGASMMLFLGHSIAVLIVARILQGISAAVVWTVGLALIRDTVGVEKLGKTFAIIFSFISVGQSVAPTFGGLVFQMAGYGGLLVLGLSISGVDAIMRLLMIEKKIAAKYQRDDEDDSSEESMAGSDDGEEVNEESPLIGETNENEEWKIPDGQPSIICKFPLLYCLSNFRLLTAELFAFMHATLLGILIMVNPIRPQGLELLYASLALSYLWLGFRAGKRVDKHGTKLVSTIGMAIMSLSYLLLLSPVGETWAMIYQILGYLLMCYLGLAIIITPSIVEASYVTEKYYEANKDLFGKQRPYAQLYAVNSILFSAGLAVGPSMGRLSLNNIGVAVIAGMCGLVSILSFVFMGGKLSILRRCAP